MYYSKFSTITQLLGVADYTLLLIKRLQEIATQSVLALIDSHTNINSITMLLIIINLYK